jgi:hypothetical protein
MGGFVAGAKKHSVQGFGARSRILGRRAFPHLPCILPSGAPVREAML